MLASIFGDAANYVLNAIGHWIAKAIAGVMTAIGAVLTDITKLQIGQSYWAIYGRVMIVAAVLGVGIVGVKAAQGALSGRVRHSLSGVAQVGGGLFAAAVLAAVLPLVQAALASIASFVAGGITGVNAAGLATKLGALTAGLGVGIVASDGALLPILGGIVLLAALGIITALIVSVALVYIVLALCPILFVLGPKAMARALEVLIVALSTPALITLMLAIGIALLADGPLTASGAITSTIVGLGIMVMGTVSPFVLIRLLPHPAIQEHFGRMEGMQGAASQHATSLPAQGKAISKGISSAFSSPDSEGAGGAANGAASAGSSGPGVASTVAGAAATAATGGVAAAAGAGVGAAANGASAASTAETAASSQALLPPTDGLLRPPVFDTDEELQPTADPRYEAPGSPEPPATGGASQ